MSDHNPRRRYTPTSYKLTVARHAWFNRDSITTCLANIHSFVLRDCKQLPWAGDLNPEVTLSTVKVHDKKKDQLKVQTVKVPNLPYSKTILQERIK